MTAFHEGLVEGRQHLRRVQRGLLRDGKVAVWVGGEEALAGGLGRGSVGKALPCFNPWALEPFPWGRQHTPATVPEARTCSGTLEPSPSPSSHAGLATDCPHLGPHRKILLL